MPGPRTPEAATPFSPAPARTPEEPSRWVRVGREAATGSRVASVGQLAGGRGRRLGAFSGQSCGRAVSGRVLLRQDPLSPTGAGSQDPEALGIRLLGTLAGKARAQDPGSRCSLWATPAALPAPALGSGETGRAPPLPVLRPRSPGVLVIPASRL